MTDELQHTPSHRTLEELGLDTSCREVQAKARASQARLPLAHGASSTLSARTPQLMTWLCRSQTRMRMGCWMKSRVPSSRRQPASLLARASRTGTPTNMALNCSTLLATWWTPGQLCRQCCACQWCMLCSALSKRPELAGAHMQRAITGKRQPALCLGARPHCAERLGVTAAVCQHRDMPQVRHHHPHPPAGECSCAGPSTLPLLLQNGFSRGLEVQTSARWPKQQEWLVI